MARDSAVVQKVYTEAMNSSVIMACPVIARPDTVEHFWTDNTATLDGAKRNTSFYAMCEVFRGSRVAQDPQERRRIQNRLNQRAFRQRQRAGESSKVYHRRSAPASPSPAADRSRIRSDDLRVDPPAEESKAHCSRYQVEPRATSAPAASQGSAASKDLFWDELARTINRNLVAATLTNARHLGLDLVALQSGTSTYTTRPSARQARPLPPTLVPVELQFQVAHDPIIDTLPHPRLRYNILHAITGGQLDAASLSRSIRASGALRQRGDEGSPRFGLVVWSEPELLASWELSEDFVRRFAFLLEGCEDLLVVTNAWRSRRGERPIRIVA